MARSKAVYIKLGRQVRTDHGLELPLQIPGVRSQSIEIGSAQNDCSQVAVRAGVEFIAGDGNLLLLDIDFQFEGDG